MDQLGHTHLQLHIESHSNVNLCPVFYLKAYLHHTKLWKKLEGSRVYSLFLGNNRQHMLVCAKKISSWVRKVLDIAKAHMSPTTFWGVEVSAALVVSVSMVSILQSSNCARVSTPARHYLSTYITTTDEHQACIQFSVLGHSEWSTSW